MAFGRRDTDNWFDKTLRPLLKSVGAQPRRVDRIEHNDDIDDRILAEIEDADFAVADLTYARPSVYFEAGYVQRTVPVIYTCRADHLNAPPDSPNRVHFDLQMKNIVPWRDPLDGRFRKRMESRLRKVTMPLLREKERSLEAAEQTRRFGALSQSRQLVVATAAIEDATSKLGLKSRSEKARLEGWGIYIGPLLTLKTKFNQGWEWQFKYLVVSSVTARLLEHLRTELRLGKFVPSVDEAGKPTLGVAEFVLIVSLHKVPLDRVRGAFPTWSVVGANPKRLELFEKWPALTPLQKSGGSFNPRKAPTVPLRHRLVVIDPVRSEEELTRVIGETVPTLIDLAKRGTRRPSP
jgi:hypothetical protein